VDPEQRNERSIVKRRVKTIELLSKIGFFVALAFIAAIVWSDGRFLDVPGVWPLILAAAAVWLVLLVASGSYALVCWIGGRLGRRTP
jgi:hypothetical protein